jgi:hypothetical protein
MTARARTFKRCEIADIMREASVNGMAAIYKSGAKFNKNNVLDNIQL